MNAALWCHFLFCLFWLAECFWIYFFLKISSWLLLLFVAIEVICVFNSDNTSYFWPDQQWWSTWAAVQSVWKLSCFGGFWEPAYILIGLKAKRSQHHVAILYWCSSASFLAPDTSLIFTKRKNPACVSSRKRAEETSDLNPLWTSSATPELQPPQISRLAAVCSVLWQECK